jgi:hypothetical protein
MDTFLDKRRVARLLNLSSETLKNYRLQGTWIEGIHWVRVSSRCVRYNAALIQDWLSNRNDPMASPPRRKRSSTGNRNLPISSPK